MFFRSKKTKGPKQEHAGDEHERDESSRLYIYKYIILFTKYKHKSYICRREINPLTAVLWNYYDLYFFRDHSQHVCIK